MRFPCPNLLTAKLARTKPIFLSGLIVLTLLAQSHSFAQNDPRVKVNIGVDGNYKARTWATVALEIDPEIANMAPVDVVLTISQRQGHEVKTLRHYSASLSSHHGDAAAELSIPIYLTPNSNYIILQISKDGRRLLQQAHFLERLERGRETFVLVLTSQPESFNIIPSIKMRYDIKTMFLSPSSLGKDWTFYHALECVIVDNVKLSSLTAEQFDAFASWLYRGGNVVFTSAGLDANASDQRLKSLSGFEYSGRRTIMSPYALAAFCDEGPDSIERLDSLEIAAENRDIFLKTQETPLILRHEAGIGFLWALTFDPQEISLKDRSRSDPIVRKIWTTILERCKRNEGSVSWNESVAEAPQTKMQNVFGPVAVYLIVLVVVLGPINYALLRKLDRREFILLTIPVVTLLLGIGAFCAGLSLKGDKAIKVTRAVTVGKAGDTVFDHRRYVGVLSPRKGLFQLSALETDGHIPHVVDPIMVTSWDEVKKVGRFPLQMRYFGDRVKVSDIEIPMWGMKFLEFQSVAKHADAISCSLNLEHGVLTGRIESAFPFPLKQCFIVSRHNKVSLGALEPRSGKDFELRILPPPSLDGIRLTAYDKQRARENIFHKIFWEKENLDDSQLKLLESVFASYRSHFETPVLIGWADSPPTDVETGREWKGAELASHLMVFKLPLFLDGNQVDVPIGLSKRACAEESWWCNPFALSVSSYLPGSLELELPFAAHEKFAVDELVVHMSRPAARDFAGTEEGMDEPSLAISVYDWTTKRWTQLLSTKEREVHYLVREAPEKYILFPQGLIRLKAELVGGGELSRFYDSSDYFDFYYGYLSLNLERPRLRPFDGVPLILLDVSLKGKSSERLKVTP